jgi:hypothetical protein
LHQQGSGEKNFNAIDMKQVKKRMSYIYYSKNFAR